MKSLLQKIVETNVNESKLDAKELNNMIIAAVSSLGDGFDVNVSIGANTLDDKASEIIASRSMGHIIENVIAAGFMTKYGTAKVKHVTPKEKLADGENNACDIILTSSKGPVNIEIKAYKKIGNLKPTAGQWKADYILCVKYNLSGKHVNIEEVNCVNPGENIDGAHIKITRDMINKGITVKK